MKANFLACQDYLHANNLLKRNQRKKEQELGATQQGERKYIATLKNEIVVQYVIKLQKESPNIKASRKLLEKARRC